MGILKHILLNTYSSQTISKLKGKDRMFLNSFYMALLRYQNQRHYENRENTDNYP